MKINTKIKRLFAAGLALCLVFSIAGCSISGRVLGDIFGAVPAEKADVSVIYFIECESLDGVETIPFSLSDCVMESIETVGEYTDEYTRYSAEYFRGVMEEKLRPLYGAFVYAFGMDRNTVVIPAERFSIDEARQAVQFLAADSPLLEANLNLDIYTATMQGAEFIIAQIPGVSVEKKAKISTAIEKAAEIVAELPENATDIDKAWQLYSHVVHNTQYIGERENYIENADFLYDAVIGGESNCDGYAEAVSLLFNMAGITTICPSYSAEEVVAGLLFRHGMETSLMLDDTGIMKPEYSFTDGRDAAETFFREHEMYEKATELFGIEDEKLGWSGVGHVVNIAKIDGEYYLFDATWEQSVREVILANFDYCGDSPIVARYFALDSRAAAFVPLAYGGLSQYLPQCSSDKYIGFVSDFLAEDTRTVGKNDIKLIAQLLENSKNSDKKYIIVYIEAGADKNQARGLFDKVAQQLTKLDELWWIDAGGNYFYIE